MKKSKKTTLYKYRNRCVWVLWTVAAICNVLAGILSLAHAWELIFLLTHIAMGCTSLIVVVFTDANEDAEKHKVQIKDAKPEKDVNGDVEYGE